MLDAHFRRTAFVYFVCVSVYPQDSLRFHSKNDPTKKTHQLERSVKFQKERVVWYTKLFNQFLSCNGMLSHSYRVQELALVSFTPKRILSSAQEMYKGTDKHKRKINLLLSIVVIRRGVSGPSGKLLTLTRFPMRRPILSRTADVRGRGRLTLALLEC
ncbi:hypothetical protein NPIL_595321 [Nephila pilipes]|uniref:Uncharacterized protein n=1 Tax=Nephila pilipes TaxID=299642 RepID=A0A8X6N0K7_NEPPI|nr:hypothetical protein NPIL_595321 [Nephila pilipes]